ncbi:hypothetical protein Tco_0986017 [Tanacetum coccineum]
MLRRSRMWLRINLKSSRRMGKELFDPNGERCGGYMTGRGGGWLAKRSIVSKEGYGGGGGGLAVRGGRSSSESKEMEIPGEVIRERGEDTIRLDGGAIW